MSPKSITLDDGPQISPTYLVGWQEERIRWTRAAGIYQMLENAVRYGEGAPPTIAGFRMSDDVLGVTPAHWLPFFTASRSTIVSNVAVLVRRMRPGLELGGCDKSTAIPRPGRELMVQLGYTTVTKDRADLSTRSYRFLETWLASFVVQTARAEGFDSAVEHVFLDVVPWACLYLLTEPDARSFVFFASLRYARRAEPLVAPKDG